ncbi:helix-turn-helix domain-containing protein [Escherichia coli]|nr:helix-turn-helix domain-containing protein [Escherichia coli]
MSVKLSAWVWDGCAAAGIKGNKLLIMLRLADYASDEGIAYPSVATIARQLGAGRSTVIGLINELVRDGWLTKRERRQGQRSTSNLYTLNVSRLRRAAAEAYAGGPDSGRPETEPPETERPESERPENPKKPGSEGPESGHDPSVNSKQDPLVEKPISPDAAQPDAERGDADEFLNGHPEAVIFSAKKRQWGSREDLTCAEWVWGKVVRLYERAAESDGEVVRPREPNWAAWANEVRLMCNQDGRTHRQICELFERANRDPFWCKNILSPGKLREKWDDLSLKLAAYSVPREDQNFRASYDDVDYSKVPDGFRV